MSVNEEQRLLDEARERKRAKEARRRQAKKGEPLGQGSSAPGVAPPAPASPTIVCELPPSAALLSQLTTVNAELTSEKTRLIDEVAALRLRSAQQKQQIQREISSINSLTREIEKENIAIARLRSITLSGAPKAALELQRRVETVKNLVETDPIDFAEEQRKKETEAKEKLVSAKQRMNAELAGLEEQSEAKAKALANAKEIEKQTNLTIQAVGAVVSEDAEIGDDCKLPKLYRHYTQSKEALREALAKGNADLEQKESEKEKVIESLVGLLDKTKAGESLLEIVQTEKKAKVVKREMENEIMAALGVEPKGDRRRKIFDKKAESAETPIVPPKPPAALPAAGPNSGTRRNFQSKKPVTQQQQQS